MQCCVWRVGTVQCCVFGTCIKFLFVWQISELQRALHDRELELEQWRGPHAEEGVCVCVCVSVCSEVVTQALLQLFHCLQN